MTLLDSEAGPASEMNPAEIPARLDRLPVLAPHIAWIALLTVNLGLGYYDNALFAYVTPAIVEHAGLTVGEVGLASSSFFAGMVIGGLFGGRLADRFGRRSIMVWGTATCSLGVIATGLAPNFETILASRTVTGIGVQASMSALLVYIVEMFPAATRGRFVSIVTSAFVIVAPIVALLALVTVPAGGPDTWRHLFILGGIGLLIAPAAHFLMPESVRWHISRDQVGKAEQIVAKLETRALRRGPLAEPDPVAEGSQHVSLRRVLGNKRIIRTIVALSIGYFGATLGLYLYQNWAMYVLVDGLSIAEADAYRIQLVWNVVYFVTPLLAWLVIDRVERKTFILASSLISAVPLAGLGLATDSLLVTSAGGVAAVVTGLVITAYFAYIPETIPTEARGLGSGIIISVGNIGGALSGVLGAALYGAWAGAGVMITAAVAFVAFSIVILIFGPRTTNRPLEGVTAEELHAA
ncbi:MFS transporter [Nocardia bhagyanarayanae]|uniref:Putative MFS transporter n=1 Tax=Nocardia bhagyanarayanae TaxID=1215925 RepID=A0A543EXZ0_9NOCA|nr:MFS transporter [Nocardia bhagyanarayanae]TQM26432.1 putative MFS transporter [Nocardia bhagyanarayanae]